MPVRFASSVQVVGQDGKPTGLRDAGDSFLRAQIWPVVLGKKPSAVKKLNIISGEIRDWEVWARPTGGKGEPLWQLAVKKAYPYLWVRTSKAW